MRKIAINGLELWNFEKLGNHSSIRHFVTDRQSHRSDGEFTLSWSSSPDRSYIEKNRQLLASAMGVDYHHLFFPSQVHQTRIVHVSSNTSRDSLLETDALITNEPGVCIAVMSADCVPIVLYDEKNNAVAAVHSGWRGTVARILEKTLAEMKKLFGTKGEDLHAGIGPSISQEVYEVGGEVVQQIKKSFEGYNDLLIPVSEEKARLDLWTANKIQLLEFGVSPRNIEISNLCTVQHNRHFFSARKGDRGRFAAGIMIAQ